MSCFLVPIDGEVKPIYAGDTIKYLTTVLDENKAPFTGTITAARSEILTLLDGVPVPMSPPVFKTLGSGITVLAGNVVEVIYVPADTAAFVAGVYLEALKVRSPDFGEMTNARRLKVQTKLLTLP